MIEDRNCNFGSLRSINELGAARIFFSFFFFLKRGGSRTKSKYIHIGLYTNMREDIRSLFCNIFDKYGSSSSVTLKSDVMSASSRWTSVSCARWHRKRNMCTYLKKGFLNTFEIKVNLNYI